MLDGVSNNFSINLNTDYLWLLFGLAFVVFAIFSFIFIYHWHKYKIKGTTVLVAELLYFSVSLILIISAISALTFL